MASMYRRRLGEGAAGNLMRGEEDEVRNSERNCWAKSGSLYRHVGGLRDEQHGKARPRWSRIATETQPGLVVVGGSAWQQARNGGRAARPWVVGFFVVAATAMSLPFAVIFLTCLPIP
jgi:hypothetical protein